MHCRGFDQKKPVKISPWRLTLLSCDTFLLLKRLFINSLVTNRSAFCAGCTTQPSSSFMKPSPRSPTANLGSPKNLPRRQGCSLPSKRDCGWIEKLCATHYGNSKICIKYYRRTFLSTIDVLKPKLSFSHFYIF